MNITMEMAFNIVMGLCVSGFWFWVKNLSESLKDADKDRGLLREQLHDIQLSYQHKDEAKEASRQITELLKEIKAEMKEINRQLNQKADK